MFGFLKVNDCGARPRHHRRVVALVPLLLWPGAAFAAGSEDGPAPSQPPSSVAKPASNQSSNAEAAPVVVSPYEMAKAAIDVKDWKRAIATLTSLTAKEPGNADAWNLLGYATRKSGSAKKALPFYEKALKLNPKHKGALEYQGEAYVELKQLSKAKANLAKLKAACGNTTCEEYVDLAKALAKK